MQEPKGIVVYGPGHVGQLAARLMLERGWKISAAVNRPGNKVGTDLGILCGLAAPIGVPVQDETKIEFSALDGDIAVITSTDRIRVNFGTYKRFMEAGFNILCVGCESSYPWAGTPDLAHEIDAIAKANGVTFCGSGFQDIHRVWLGKTLIGSCTTLRSYCHRSQTDISPHGAETARLVHAGLSLDDFAKQTADSKGRDVSIYRVFLEHMTRSLGLTILHVEETLEPVTKPVPLHCPALDIEIPAGACTGTRFKTVITTEEGIVATAENELRLFEPGEEATISWVIDGDPPCEVVVTKFDSHQGTSAPLINRIPQVLAAPAGIVTITDLGPAQFLGNPSVELVYA
jgi:hypothetical protein